MNKRQKKKYIKSLSGINIPKGANLHNYMVLARVAKNVRTISGRSIYSFPAEIDYDYEYTDQMIQYAEMRKKNTKFNMPLKGIICNKPMSLPINLDDINTRGRMEYSFIRKFELQGIQMSDFLFRVLCLQRLGMLTDRCVNQQFYSFNAKIKRLLFSLYQYKDKYEFFMFIGDKDKAMMYKTLYTAMDIKQMMQYPLYDDFGSIFVSSMIALRRFANLLKEF